MKTAIRKSSRADPRARSGADQQNEGYFHPGFGAHAVKVMLGEHPVLGLGGMNHFLLPTAPSGGDEGVEEAARYGGVAMERLINSILQRGGRRDRLEVKVFGGAKVIENSNPIGAGNAAFVLDYIEREGLILVAQDLGGTLARRLHYFPSTGRAMRRMLQQDAVPDTIRSELRFMSDLRNKPIEGAIELFGDK
jgi:chemotaxis protein CheD